MFNRYLSNQPLVEKLPTQLIQKPLEIVILIVSLIAFGQFMTHTPEPLMSPSLSWFLTAPGLMVLFLVIAIRTHHSTPLVFAFISGVSATLFYFNPDIGSIFGWLQGKSVSSIEQGSLQFNFQQANKNFMFIGIYALTFWIALRHFFVSRIFSGLKSVVNPTADNKLMVMQFERVLFNMTFGVLNAMLIFSLNTLDSFLIIIIFLATLLLFVSGEHFSKKIRGILLPVYCLLMLTVWLWMPSVEHSVAIGTEINSALNSKIGFFILASVLLWLGHNVLSKPYNIMFPKLAIETDLWPWFGLFILIGFLFESTLELVVQPYYLIIIISYAFLMLRNTFSPFVPWLLILSMSWLMVVLSFPLSGKLIDQYGQLSLVYGLSLMAFSYLWGRYINPFFSRFGWQMVSFEISTYSIAFAITTLWFLSHIILVAGLLTGLYDLIDARLATEVTMILVIVSYIALSRFYNNQWLANLIHASFIFLLIVFWGMTESLPIYAFFALVNIAWVLIPSGLTKVTERFGWELPEHFINTSVYWGYLSFVATLVSIPWDAASVSNSVTLFLMGIFYIFNNKNNRPSQYMGFFLINLSVYIWMPLLSDYTSLMLFYVMPVSLSVLIILYLHKGEIKADLQNKLRFIALSSLYLIAAADIFISSSLWLFLLGLCLGLISSVYGVSSKTRAFLYTGVGFILMNILGQLIVFYPEERLGRALILMSMGAVITGTMVWFNIKREMLLEKIRVFRADLEQWQ
ncbi:MAG: hypothetical protein GY694_17790 [Gammaproteobacteria bacterium]|nr:hypothetical protein [Gammaproteobacteria bacterium]